MASTNVMDRRVASDSRGRGDDAWRTPGRPDSRARGATDGEGLASLLGWFSIGLGLTEILAPRRFAAFIGATGDADSRAVVRLVGLRELAAGVGILTRPRPAGWVWARVAGDVMDLSLLGGAMAADAPGKDRLAKATTAVLAITALDVYDAVQLSRRPGPSSGHSWVGGPIEVRKAVTIKRPAEELYRFWRDFQNLPRFMTYLESVQVLGDRRSHWKARGPAGKTIEWDAEIVDDRPNERIAWRSLPGADVDNSGSVRFVRAPGGRGTEVHVEMRYDPPGGAIGAMFAKLLGREPGQMVALDLLHFKQLMETGEIVLADGGLDGSLVIQRPAQPLPEGNGR